MLRRLWLAIAQALAIGVGIGVVVLLYVHFVERDPRVRAPLPGEPQTAQPAVSGAQPPATPPQTSVGNSPIASLTFHPSAQRAMPSVVNVFTAKRLRRGRPRLPEGSPLWRFFGEPPAQQRSATSLGSGVIVTSDGLILTNNHVIEGADEISVVLAGSQRASARVVGTDPDTDLAVIKADAQGLTPITFGDSDRIQVGDVVLAIGDPFGVGQTVTMGIVSATGRNRLGINPIENFIQTDAPINPGNSGGALVDINGDLVGINSAIYSETGGSLGIGFAIPVSMAKQVMEQLVTSGRVRRGWLGVQIGDITPEAGKQLGVPDGKGAMLSGIIEGGPADRAGLRAGDVVRSINGKPVDDASALLKEITAMAPGQTAELGLLRRGNERLAKVEVAERPRPTRE